MPLIYDFSKNPPEDTENESNFDSTLHNHGTPDVVIDTEVRATCNVIKTFEMLYNKIDKNGLYIIMRTSATTSTQPDKLTEYCKDMLDAIHAKRNGLDGNFAEMTYCISFHRKCIVFEKRYMSEDATKSIMIPRPPLTFGRIAIRVIKALRLSDIAIFIWVKVLRRRAYILRSAGQAT